MSHRHKLFTMWVLVAMLVGACQPVLLPVSEPVATSVPSYTPEFLSTGCLYPIPPEVEADCGFLLVPEDRSQPDGKIIRLHVVRLRATGQNPTADPLILLNGGPGSPGMPMVGAMWDQFTGRLWRLDRDVVYIDQRGTNFSVPKLYCPETASLPPDFFSLPYTEEVAHRTRQVEVCYQRLIDEGTNVSAYNVAESAADINDLRIVLGYDKVNLYGFSYGSLLALTVMRQYPENMRSVTLDAVWPPGIDMQQEKPFCIRSGLDALFTGCNADEACRTAFPNIEEEFYTVLNRLREAPVETTINFAGVETPILLDDLKFLSYIVGTLQQGEIRFLPAEITSAYAGDFRIPATVWLGGVRGGANAPRPGYSGTAYGMYYSAMCSYTRNFAGEQGASCANEQSNECREMHPSLLAYAADYLQACHFWDVEPLTPQLAVTPVESDVPTLMLSGTYDCGLPPYLSNEQTKRLANSYDFELPSGHGAAFSTCGLNLIMDFLRDPTHPPRANCTHEMKVEWILQE